MNWEIIGQIVGLVMAAFAVVTYIRDKLIARRNRTIEKVGELLEEYHEKYANLDINSSYKQHVRFLSKIEQFCIAVDSGVYSKWILKKYGSKFLTDRYKKYEKNVIEKRRKQYGKSKYHYYEKLVKWFDLEEV